MARILVVDDEKSLLTLYQRELQDDGHQVRTAADAHEALEWFKNERPDLVVLDIRLPGFNGLEAISCMMSIDKGVPVILNTAYPAFRDDFTSWLADAYVDKSSDLAELKKTIRDLLHARALRGDELLAGTGRRPKRRPQAVLHRSGRHLHG